MTLKLDKKQRYVVRELLRGYHRGGAIIAGQLGSGKTNVAVTVALKLAAEGVILLICPVKGTRIAWMRTFRRAGYRGEFRYLTLADKENFDRMKAGEPGIYIIGREYVAGAATDVKRKEVVTRPALVQWNRIKTIDVAIYDESHYASNRKSAAFKHWQYIRAKHIKMELSGTWFGNSLEGAWAAARALWPTLIDRSFWRWVDTWLVPYYQCPNCFEFLADDEPGLCPECYHNITARDIIRGIQGEKTPGAFADSLPAYFYWEPDIPDDDPAKAVPLQHPLYVELTGTHAKEYKRMEDEALAWLEEHPLEADLPITKKARLRQMALGMPSIEFTGGTTWDGEPEGNVTFAENAVSPKIDALNEFLADHPEPVLVLTDSKQFAKILPSRLKADVMLWTGDTKRQERERILTEWNSGVLVATIPAIAEGVDGLQHVCHTVVWLNKSNNSLLNEQALGRLRRRGQSTRVVEVPIIAVNTVDEDDNNRLAQIVSSRRKSMGRSL